jgi:hypothetical protein
MSRGDRFPRGLWAWVMFLVLVALSHIWVAHTVAIQTDLSDLDRFFNGDNGLPRYNVNPAREKMRSSTTTTTTTTTFHLATTSDRKESVALAENTTVPRVNEEQPNDADKEEQSNDGDNNNNSKDTPATIESSSDTTAAHLLTMTSTRKQKSLVLADATKATVASTDDDDEDEGDSSSSNLLLSVPFYIYEGWGVGDEYPNTILHMNRKKFDIRDLDPRGVPIHSKKERRTKHADDYYMAMAARDHPMRVMDPSLAKLFYVPTPFNILMEGSFYKKVNRVCLYQKHKFNVCNKDAIQLVNAELGKSPWFQRHEGRDHILVASHWMWTTIWQWHVGTWDIQNIHKCNAIDFEGQLVTKTNRTDRIYFPSYYVGKRCRLPVSTRKTQKFAMITTLERTDIGKIFEDRTNICKWVPDQYPMKACGIGPQCPALAHAKFGFHAVGDTPGSNRLMDTILSHTIPIITRPEQYDVLPKWIDWDQISYFANVSDKNVFMETLKQITSDKQTIQQKQEAVAQNQDLFDYQTIVPFDTYMYMFQIALFPETKRTNMTTPYSALILP